MRLRSAALVGLALSACHAAACHSGPDFGPDHSALAETVDASVIAFQKKDESLTDYFVRSEGYAVFPAVATGEDGSVSAKGILIGDHRELGHCSLTQAATDPPLGTRVYQEVVFFETSGALETFQSGSFHLHEHVRAVAAKSGAGLASNYEDGVAVFTLEAGEPVPAPLVAGQHFDFEPLD